MAETLNPILSADRWNKILELGKRRFQRSLALIFLNVFQDGGRMAGQSEYRNRMQELVDLMLLHDQHLDIATQDELPGRRQQAMNELLREERLRREVFGDAEQEAQS